MSSAYLHAWLDLLDASCTQVSISCLDIIIDQAGSSAPSLPGVLSVEPPMLWYSLFTGLPEEGAADLAPLLVRMDLTIPLQRQWFISLMHGLHSSTQLLVLASHWPFQALAEHLGRCLEASNGDRMGLLRYYDPRLFPLLFSHVLRPEQKQLWTRPAVFWSWLDRDGAPQRLLGTPDWADSVEDVGPVELSDSQIDTLGCASDATLALANLRTVFPPEWGAEQCFQACYAAMLEATQAGLKMDTEREAFALERLRSL